MDIARCPGLFPNSAATNLPWSRREGIPISAACPGTAPQGFAFYGAIRYLDQSSDQLSISIVAHALCGLYIACLPISKPELSMSRAGNLTWVVPIPWAESVPQTQG